MRDNASASRFSDEEFAAVDNLNEAVFDLYEHAAARNLDTLSPELADMIEDAWKFLQPVKRLGLLGRLTDSELGKEKERRGTVVDWVPVDQTAGYDPPIEG